MQDGWGLGCLSLEMGFLSSLSAESVGQPLKIELPSLFLSVPLHSSCALALHPPSKPLASLVPILSRAGAVSERVHVCGEGLSQLEGGQDWLLLGRFILWILKARRM